jgi:hypothetical protein
LTTPRQDSGFVLLCSELRLRRRKAAKKINGRTLHRRQNMRNTVSGLPPPPAGWPPGRVSIYKYPYIYIYIFTHIHMSTFHRPPSTFERRSSTADRRGAEPGPGPRRSNVGAEPCLCYIQI